MKEEDSTLGLKSGSGSVRPEMAAETTEAHKHWSRTRVQKWEQRSQEGGESSKGIVDWGAVQEHREGNDVRKQQGAYNTLKTLTKTQLHKSAVFEESSGNILMESTLGLNRWTE